MIANAVSQLEIRFALRLIALEDRIQASLGDPKIRQHILAAILATATVSLLLFAHMALGSDGAEYAQASTTIEGWVKGNPGKACALVGVFWGFVQALIKKDMVAFGMPTFAGILVGVFASIIDATFTATV